MPRLNR